MSHPIPRSAEQPDLRSRIAQTLALAIILITPSLYSFHFMSFMDAKLAGLIVGVALLAIVADRERTLRRDRLMMFAPLVVLVLWATVVGFVQTSVSLPGSGEGVAGRFGAVLLAALLLLGAAPATSIQRSVTLSAVPVSVLALAQYAGLLPGMFPDFPEYGQRMYSVFGNQDLLGGYVALGLVLGFALWLDRALAPALAGLLFVTAGPTLLLSGSRSAWLAALAGAAFAAWQGRTERRRVGGVIAASLAVLVAMIAIAPGATWERFTGTFASVDAGYRIRLWIWDGTIRLIGEHPVTGIGLGNFAFHSPRALGEVLHERGPGVHMFNHIHTQHAHSDLLEIIAESGVVGLVLLLLFVLYIPRRRSPVWPALAAAFIFSLINTTLHSPPHLLAVLLLAGSVREDESPSIQGSLHGRWSRAVFAGFCIVVPALWTVDTLYASALYARAQALYEAGDTRAEAAYERAAIKPANSAAAVELATIQTNAGREWEAISTAYSATFGVDTGELYYLRAHLSERVKRPDSAILYLYRECLLRWPDHAPAYAGLLRNTDPDEQREVILAEAKRWLSPADYAALTVQASAEALSTPSLP